MAFEHSSAECVPREIDILHTVSDILGQLGAGDELTPPVINLVGITGIGKTCVLQQLFDTHKASYNLLWLGFNLKDAPQPRSDKHNPALALQQRSWTAAAEQLNALLGRYDQIGTQVMFDSQVAQPLDQLGDILMAQAAQSEHNRPLLLLLDSLDHLPYWKWLQEQVLKPLFERERTVIVCASQAELYWHFWELREHREIHEIAGFAADETRQFLEAYHADLLAETVQKLTGGYPLVLKHFAALLAVPTTTPEAVDTFRQAINQLSDDVRPILEQVGLLRREHVAVMQDLLCALSGEDWSKPAQHWRLQQALQEFHTQGFMGSPHDQFGRFALEIRNSLREQLAPHEYLRRCRLIADLYYPKAYKHPKTAADSLAEWLFFSSMVLLADPDPQQRAVWEAQLEKLLARVSQVAQSEQSVRNSLVRQPNQHQSSLSAKVSAWLYTDGELLQNLDRLGVLSRIYNQLKPLLEQDDGEVQIRHDLRRAASAAFADLGRRIKAMWAPRMSSFEVMLSVLLEKQRETQQLGKDFDKAAIRSLLTEQWKSLGKRSTRGLDEFITILNSSGILLYDRDQRVYSFSPAIEKLLLIAPPLATTGQSSTNTQPAQPA